jgi:hypothetical protein
MQLNNQKSPRQQKTSCRINNNNILFNKHVPTWLILSADYIKDKVDLLNVRAAPNLVGTPIQCYDVEQFYTNVPHADLKAKLKQVALALFDWQLSMVPDNVKNRGAALVDGSQLYLVATRKYYKQPHKWMYLKRQPKQRARPQHIHGASPPPNLWTLQRL